MSDRVRIGVIGIGMGMNHAAAALASDEADLAAIADPSAERVERFRSEYEGAGDVPVFDDYHDMIEKAGLDAVVIALPTDMHTESSIFALEHGLHVLCEKPPTVTGDEMATVERIVRETGKVYMFARQQRFNPETREARELVAEGRIGRVYHAESRWMRTKNIPFRHGWGVNKDTGGGVLLDLGIHKLDDAWFVMGCPKPVSAYSVMHCGFPHLAPDDLSYPYNADDSTTALIRFADGSSLEFTVTFALNIDWHEGYRVEDPGFPEWQELRVYGDHGGLDVHKQKLIDNSGESIAVSTYEIRDEFRLGESGFAPTIRAQIGNFVTAVRDGKPGLNTAGQALDLMRMLDALKQSAGTGESVRM